MKGDTLSVDPYRASPTNLRKRLNHSQVKQLEAQILDVLEADNPQSVRHVFYRLTDPRLSVPIEKSERGYKQVQQRLVKMRRSGMLPLQLDIRRDPARLPCEHVWRRRRSD